MARDRLFWLDETSPMDACLDPACHIFDAYIQLSLDSDLFHRCIFFTRKGKSDTPVCQTEQLSRALSRCG